MRQAVQLPNHEVCHIIGITFGVDALQIPRPSPVAMIEREQCLLGERRHELNGEKWIASSLFMNQFCQRGD